MVVESGTSAVTKRVRVANLDPRYVSLVRYALSLERVDHIQDSCVIGIMSVLASEGTSTVACNIALTAAGLDTGPVLLVDANDRNPSLHKTFSLDRRIGLQNTLAGQYSPLECVTSSPIEHLSLVLNGRLNESESAVYCTSSIDEVVADWRGVFRLIIVDLPPASSVSDGVLLASRLDGVLFVIQTDRLDRRVAASTVAKLRHAGVNLIGAVCNKATAGKGNVTL